MHRGGATVRGYTARVRGAVLALAFLAGRGGPAAWASGPLRAHRRTARRLVPAVSLPAPAADDPRWLSAPARSRTASLLAQPAGGAGLGLSAVRAAARRATRAAGTVHHAPRGCRGGLPQRRAGGRRGLIGPRFATAVAGPRVAAAARGALREGRTRSPCCRSSPAATSSFYMGPFLLGERDEIEVEAGRALLPIVAHRGGAA